MTIISELRAGHEEGKEEDEEEEAGTHLVLGPWTRTTKNHCNFTGT